MQKENSKDEQVSEANIGCLFKFKNVVLDSSTSEASEGRLNTFWMQIKKHYPEHLPELLPFYMRELNLGDAEAVNKFKVIIERIIATCENKKYPIDVKPDPVANFQEVSTYKIPKNIMCIHCDHEAVIAFTGRNFKKEPELIGLCPFCLSQIMREMLKHGNDILARMG